MLILKKMRKIAFILIAIFLIGTSFNTARSIWDIYKKQDLLTDAQKELEKEKSENAKLKAQLSYVDTKEFVEEEARNKLFLVKEGEQEIILDDDLFGEEDNKKQKEEKTNWEKWLELFFR